MQFAVFTMYAHASPSMAIILVWHFFLFCASRSANEFRPKVCTQFLIWTTTKGSISNKSRPTDQDKWIVMRRIHKINRDEREREREAKNKRKMHTENGQWKYIAQRCLYTGNNDHDDDKIWTREKKNPQRKLFLIIIIVTRTEQYNCINALHAHIFSSSSSSFTVNKNYFTNYIRERAKINYGQLFCFVYTIHHCVTDSFVCLVTTLLNCEEKQKF